MTVQDLQGPGSFIPTNAIVVDLSGGTDHQFDTSANSKPTQKPFARRIFVGVAGDVVVRYVGASADVTYKAQAGQYISGAIIAVRSSSTATNMIAEQ